MFRSRSGLTRRQFLSTAAAGAAWLPSISAQLAPGRQVLHNGIVLPTPWPPRRGEWIGEPETPPYLLSPPPVIGIDVGRQLFVDDFLIAESGLHRAFHSASYHDANPVLRPEKPWELTDPQAAIAGYQPSPSASVFSDGVFYDAQDRLFKMWYMAGYQDRTAMATSQDGVRWDRPAFDVERGTNIVSNRRRDSSTVWLDRSASDARSRFKMSNYDLGLKAMHLLDSGDGVHWRPVGLSGQCGDRSTFFRDPFRQMWVFSLRHDVATLNRTRRFVESRDFASATWQNGAPVSWVGADRLDPPNPAVPATRTELYNLDVVAYESVLLGLFSIFRGEPRDREKPNDLCVGFSRDGFHWSRLFRAPFIGVSNTPGDWNYANVQSAGGCCVIANDRLHFYVSGRGGIKGTSLPGACSTGLATLRRDGFASVSDQWPSGVARAVSATRGTLTTRPIRFTGSQLFINANIAGELRVEVLDANAKPIEGFAADRCVPVTGDSTRLAVRWAGNASLARFANTPIRFRFVLKRAQLFAFWVSPSERGESRGYVAAGGPGFAGEADA